MIVWVNGAFGAGKTQAAFELVRRLDRAVLCDPEVVGYGLQRLVPPRIRRDFQDEPAWRLGVVDGLSRADADPLTDVVVAPMTLVVDAYAEEVLGGLRERGHDVRHVILDCAPEVLRERLRMRIAGIRKEDTWALAQVDRCVTALATIDADAHPLHIDSGQMGHDEVVEAIAAGLGLQLARPRRAGWARPLQTLANSARVIRF